LANENVAQEFPRDDDPTGQLRACPAKPDDVDQDVYDALLARTADQLAKRGIVSRGSMPAAAQITALAQGDFEQRVADAIAAG